MRITVKAMEVLAVLTVFMVGGFCPDAAADQDDATDRTKEKFFIKNYSTTTETTISAVTSVIPYLCFFTGTTTIPSCMGRRLRRSRKMSLNLDDVSSSLHATTDLASSGSADEEIIASDKFFFTLYRSVTTTVTVTTTSTNKSTTVSVSAYCTYAGFTGPVC